MDSELLHRSHGGEVIAALSHREFVSYDELVRRIDPLSEDEADAVLGHCIEPHELGGVIAAFYVVAAGVAVGLAEAAGTAQIDEGAVGALLAIAPTVAFRVRHDVGRVRDAHPARADHILVVGDEHESGTVFDVAFALFLFGAPGGLLALLTGNVWLAFFAVVGGIVGRDLGGLGLRAFAARRHAGPFAKPMVDVGESPYLTYDANVHRAIEAFGR